MEHFEQYLSCDAGCVADNRLLVINSYCSALISYDFEDFSYEVISYGVLLSDEASKGISAMIKEGDIVFFIIREERIVVEMNLTTGECLKYKQEPQPKVKSAIWRIQRIDNILYIFPIDLSTGISRFDINKRSFLEPIELDSLPSDWGHAFIYGKRIFAFLYRRNNIISFSLEGDKLEEYILNQDISIDNVTLSEDKFIVFSCKDRLIREWSPCEGITVWNSTHSIARNADSLTINILMIDALCGCIACLSYDGEMLSVLDNKTKLELVVDVLSKCEKIRKEEKKLFSGSVIIDNCIVFLPKNSNNFLIFNCDTKQVYVRSCKLRQEDVLKAKFMRLKSPNKQIVYEEQGYCIESYINAICEISEY